MRLLSVYVLWNLFIVSAGFVLSLIEPRVNVSPPRRASDDGVEGKCETDPYFLFSVNMDSVFQVSFVWPLARPSR